MAGGSDPAGEAGGSDPASEEGGGVRADWTAEERVVREAAAGIPPMRRGRVDRRSSDLGMGERETEREYGGGAVAGCGIRSWGLDFFSAID